jgi:hypothetical protein
VKFLCLISAIFVLLLSAKPCCTDNECGNKDQVTARVLTKSSPKEKECKGCSPFFACGSCSGFTVTRALNYALLLLPGKPVKHTNTYRQPYMEDVALAIWQPPQLG